MKKTWHVIFSEISCEYLKEAPFVYDNKPIPFEAFYKYLGVEISDKCKFDMVKKERTIKARNAIFVIRQALITSGDVSVLLAMKLFNSKIEPILTYGSVIWGIERNNNSIIIEGLQESNQANLKEKEVS